MPQWLVNDDAPATWGGHDGDELSPVTAYKLAATLAWVLGTDFTSAQFDDFVSSVVLSWRSRTEREHLRAQYVEAFDELQGSAGRSPSADVWRRQRLALLRGRNFRSRNGDLSEVLSWAGRLDAAVRQTLVSEPEPLTSQAAICFVEATLVLGRVMVFGASRWRPEPADLVAGVVHLVSAWPGMRADSRQATVSTTFLWPSILWDTSTVSSWYTEFWLHDLAADLATALVPGFARWRAQGAREFLGMRPAPPGITAARRGGLGRPPVESDERPSARPTGDMSGMYDERFAVLRCGYRESIAGRLGAGS